MRLSRTVALGLVLALAAASATLAGRQKPQDVVPPQSGAFRSGVDVVSLNVTVTDPANRYVTDLTQDDFSVYEDGVKQDVTFFSRTNLPLAVSLLVDTSASMDEKIATVRAAAGGFVAHLRPEDRTQLINFDSRVNVLLPFTSAHPDLDRAIASLSAGGSTALYNAVYIALKELKKNQARSADELRRQAIVLLTDGEDTSSLVSFEEVLDQTKRSETAVYAIGLRAQDSNIGKAYSEAEYVLRQLTTQTGGRVFFPETVADLPAIYNQIWQELSSQYLLGYSSKNPRRDGRWRRVVVRVERPGTSSRTKQGYYGPSL
ncbi:MAG: VWA domain-containing protein [Acidobacteria bacterium]|nr:VWA domain-containing protein [Acidobacteriota bacterium]